MPTISEALAEAARSDPDLSPYYELHNTLFELQDKVKSGITATWEIANLEASSARQLQGLPLLAFEQLPIEAGRFANLADEIAQTMRHYYTPDLDEDSLPANAAEWLSLAKRRFEANRGHSEERGERAYLTLAEIAADQALKPYLEWAASQVLPYINQQQWRQRYCPICGGLSDFAFLQEETGERFLLCSRCNSQWLYRRFGCSFCGDSDRQMAYYPSDDGIYRLYVCEACRRYLKTKDLRQAGQHHPVEIERLLTVTMDAAARQAGYY